MWSLEQALSKVIQVEIFDSATLNEFKVSDLKYVDRMNHPISWSEVPTRILQRYAENAEYLIKSISKFFKHENVAEISNVQDTYGFKKTLILLTEPGKLFAL